MKKKFFGFSTLLVTTLPILTVISCGDNIWSKNMNVDLQTTQGNKLKTEFENTQFFTKITSIDILGKCEETGSDPLWLFTIIAKGETSNQANVEIVFQMQEVLKNEVKDAIYKLKVNDQKWIDSENATATEKLILENLASTMEHNPFWFEAIQDTYDEEHALIIAS